jgi:hypothetical protein
VSIYGALHLIRDDVTGRTIDANQYDPANTSGLDQNVFRLPVQYEGDKGGGSRYVVGGDAIVSFVPTTSNAWYRVVGPASLDVDGRLIVKQWRNQSAELTFDVNPEGGSTGAEINVLRAIRSSGSFPATVTKVRAGSYNDPSTGNYPFLDLYVDHLAGTGDPNYDKIQISYPIEGTDLGYSGGQVPLVVPSGPLSSMVPAGCTLNQCVTNSLIR